MSTRIRLLAIVAMGLASVTACASQHPTSPQASTAKSPTPSASSPVSAVVSTTVSPTTSTPECTGLSICAPPPPDAQGNPPCFYSDGWQAATDGGIEVWYFHEPQNLSQAEKVTAVVRKTDGTTQSQEADVAAGQQVHRFEFPTIDKSVVAEVFFDTAAGRCFVAGPGI
ncbi:hypothetical protein BST27_00230 [Mycobacterium intermedium]|uniref:DUF3558 domain-containing protein n=1 Tax=Mycobacterium intermedium TaxID=28445 RepID=A0A1E3SFC8_MYCIE|nr:hypothetical protein [Mycobacterium intermedium]ODR00795.1 hypothetical protein BHQ20_11420 [Mycobacterium intermedium]OPE52113.1 hypothetical protein BV508_03540 [Mycobacterium intermedium]ORB10599.1 hypothetical protein BST27_00230 [Mycobacterium intermedium]